MIVKTNVFFELEDTQVSLRGITAAIKAAWMRKGNDANTLKEINVYVKSEEKTAYFVAGSINGKVSLNNADDLSSYVTFCE